MNDLKRIIIDDIEYELTKIQELKQEDTVLNIGDWIVFEGKPYFIHNEYEDYFYVRSTDGILKNIHKSNEIHKWTIADAKEGDILFSIGSVFIYKGIDTECKYTTSGNAIIYHISLTSGRGKDLNIKEFIGVGSTEDKYIRPASREERELLLLTMSCYGYEWDNDNMELKKIIKRNCNKCPFNEQIETL